MADGINPTPARPTAGPARRVAQPGAVTAPSAASAAAQDAYVRQAPSADLATLAALVAELQARIASVEGRVAALAGQEAFAPVPLGSLARTGSAVWREAAPAVPPRARQPAPANSPEAGSEARAAAPLPASSAGSTSRPAAASATYTVRPGDTLWTIAARQLGDPTRFQEIVEGNRQTHPSLAASPDFLKPGWTLTLPADPAPPARLPAAKQADAAGRSGRDGSGQATTATEASAPEPAPGNVLPARKPEPLPAVKPKPARAAKPASDEPKPTASRAPARTTPKAVEAEVLPPEAATTGQQGAAAAPARPAGQAMPVPVPNPADLVLPGFDPSKGFVVERQETQVEAVETETDTRWEVGPDGKAKVARQETDVTAAETVTRTRWRAKGVQPSPPTSKPPASEKPPAAISPPADQPPALPVPPADKPPVQAQPPAAKPPAQGQPPADKPAPKPDEARQQRLRKELDAYLAEHTDSAAVVNLAQNHPEYLEAATLPQKAKLMRQALGGLFTDKKDRTAALKVMQVAQAQGELLGVLNQLHEQKKLVSAIRTLSGSEQGREMAKLFHGAGLYANSGVVQAMDGAAVSDMLLTLGWRHPMIGTSDALLALPESHKKAMIAKLVEGDFSLQDHRQASWLNQHLGTPIKLPAYDPHRGR